MIGKSKLSSFLNQVGYAIRKNRIAEPFSRFVYGNRAIHENRIISTFFGIVYGRVDFSALVCAIQSAIRKNRIATGFARRCVWQFCHTSLSCKDVRRVSLGRFSSKNHRLGGTKKRFGKKCWARSALSSAKASIKP